MEISQMLTVLVVLNGLIAQRFVNVYYRGIVLFAQNVDVRRSQVLLKLLSFIYSSFDC
jgi:hypothetical protein